MDPLKTLKQDNMRNVSMAIAYMKDELMKEFDAAKYVWA